MSEIWVVAQSEVRPPEYQSWGREGWRPGGCGEMSTTIYLSERKENKTKQISLLLQIPQSSDRVF